MKAIFTAILLTSALTLGTSCAHKSKKCSGTKCSMNKKKKCDMKKAGEGKSCNTKKKKSCCSKKKS